MPKQRIDVTVDQDVWFYYRSGNINISSLVNDILKTKMSIQEIRKDEKELEEEIKQIANQISSLQAQRDELHIHLIQIREDNTKKFELQQKADEERLQRVKSTVRSIQKSRGWQDAN